MTDRIARLRDLVEGLAGQQAMADDSWRDEFNAICDALQENGECLKNEERLAKELVGLGKELRTSQKQALMCQLERDEMTQKALELAAAVDRLTAALREKAKDWKESAEITRLYRGQQTRTKAGHEVLANCAYALEDMLAALAPADPEGK